MSYQNSTSASFTLSSTGLRPSTTAGVTVAAWVFMGNAVPGGASRSLNAVNDYSLEQAAFTKNIYFYASDSVAGTSNAYFTLSTAQVTEWVLVVGWWDPSDKKAHISVNDVAGNDGAALSNTINTTSTTPAIGAGSTGLQVQDNTVMWPKILTADERSALYAAGAGLFYPEP